MKHTIKTSKTSAVVVSDTYAGGDEIFMSIVAILSDKAGDYNAAGVELTEDQAGAVIFALEQALEARQLRRDRALACAGTGLCSVPAVACQTPVACGMAA